MAGESQREPQNEPDPTVVTTQNIDKEITHLRELIEMRMQERDMRYTERFKGQELAVKSAFKASEKAISKAETSIEKRADATYVSLQELSRSLATIMPRTEVESRIAALSEKVDAADKKADRIEALKAGGTEQRTDWRLNLGVMIGASTLFLSFVVVLVNVLLK